ncbi:ABC transporter substrate-binding protein [Streptantibioticus rubrisoli]|uniref:ABC transporter substrate-binding protein n=1 Tax=Streptantibioticus rubrisoli TaxID=1387313 RepID=A0ABT1P5N8_9ACTN|nr:ABC transporter substrate-binding protein [Streptantibioticus rubrisoli]MCQ4040679.1 ABC transporter substrate-binding protein [Streptantibioticus rubrisoli]
MRYGSWGPLTRWLAATVALVALLAAGWGVYLVLRPDLSCGPGVVKRGPAHECTGVSDGRVSFGRYLDQVTDRIRAENDSPAVARGPHVTVAMMVPMSSTGPADQQQVLHEVQGAYLAQYRANHDDNGRAPAIRLVLANPGRDSGSWPPVAAELARMAASTQDNLRAVVGFDISVPNTQATIDELTNTYGVPVVEGPMTADDIANSPSTPAKYKGLARIAATNSDQAAALASYDRSVRPQQTLVVEDVRGGDNYVRTLRQAFESRTKGAPLAPEQFRSPPDTNSEGSTANDFQQMVSTICESPAKVIYFAGRPVQLRQFVNALGARGCTDHDYTVISGSGASTIALDPLFDWDALRRGVTLLYASDGHPDAWTSAGAPATGGSADAYRTLTKVIGEAGAGAVDLTDSRAISVYDSAWTAITAIRDATHGGSGLPTTTDVADEWLRLHGAQKVLGVSGWICLDNYGNPYDKAVSVVRLSPATGRADFAGLAWPTGHPPTADCTAPNGG